VVAAAVAVPALLARPGGEHRDRRCPSRLGVVRIRARPAPRPGSASVGTQQLVGELAQVDRGDDGIAVPADSTNGGRRAGGVTCHALLGRR
jgi:hypothetical protein